MLACRRVLARAGGGARIEWPLLWAAVWTVLLFLIAGNTITSPFAHLLHIIFHQHLADGGTEEGFPVGDCFDRIDEIVLRGVF